MDSQGKAKVALTFALYQGDQRFVIGMIATNLQKLLRGPRELAGFGFCYPLRAAYTLGEHMFGESLLALPFYVATGDQGEIHRVTPDGQGSVFYRSEESHARSLAVDAQDNVIVGTEPNGLVIRVSPTGEGFVLYEMPKKEVTAVAVAKDGSVSQIIAPGTRPPVF